MIFVAVLCIQNNSKLRNQGFMINGKNFCEQQFQGLNAGV